MRRQKTHTSARLAAYSVAAGAAALGAASTANAALNVFDHRAAPLYPIVTYTPFDQTLMLMDVKTGDFQYVVTDAWDPASLLRYDQDGFVDNNPIPEVDKTNDTVWFSHRDVDCDTGFGPKPGDVVTLETPSGGAGGQLDAGQGPVYTPGWPNRATATLNDWYMAEQTYDHDNDAGTPDETWALPLPVDGPAIHQVDGLLDFNDASPTGYTGAVTHGFGGQGGTGLTGIGHGNGSRFYVEGPDGWAVSVGFKLEEADGPHYGWVAFYQNADRNRVRSVYGWGYQTTPYMPAELTWIGDPVGVEGDFTGDGFVDAEDIDELCDNMASLDPQYDLDDGTGTGTPDGVVDELDMIYHVQNLVEWDNGVDNGVGTKRGDFNLDGFIDGTDLALMKTAFGQPLMNYADGNANCDAFVDGTDLAILKTNFGFIAPPGGSVPEPVTLSLLALGATGLAAKRRRKS